MPNNEEFYFDEETQKIEEVADEVTSILDKDKKVRDAVFFQLRSKQDQRLKDLAAVEKIADGEIANGLAFCPEKLQCQTEAEKAKAREVIKLEINGLWGEIRASEISAGKLLRNSVYYAKAIGDRLWIVKKHLTKHNEYEKWVEDNFDGGLSTARGYKRIAAPENWAKIARKLIINRSMTIPQAWNLIKKGVPEKDQNKQKSDPESWRRQHIKTIKDNFARLIKYWPAERLGRVAHDFTFMAKIQELANVKRYANRYGLKLQTQRELLKEFKPGWKLEHEIYPQDQVTNEWKNKWEEADKATHRRLYSKFLY